MLKPLKAERSLMKMTGTSILSNANKHNTSMQSLNYGIIPEKKGQGSDSRDPYGSITVNDML